jgi:uncharacterized protein
MSNDAALDQAAGGAADRPGWHPAVAWLTDRLAAIPSVERVVLFGSRARGDHGPRPDIDLAVEAPEASTEDRARMVELVEDAPTLLAIDLVRLDTAEPALRRRSRAKESCSTSETKLARASGCTPACGRRSRPRGRCETCPPGDGRDTTRDPRLSLSHG